MLFLGLLIGRFLGRVSCCLFDSPHRMVGHYGDGKRDMRNISEIAVLQRCCDIA